MSVGVASTGAAPAATVSSGAAPAATTSAPPRDAADGALVVTPENGACGASVSGLDLRDADSYLPTLRRLLDEHLVLFFPGQDLDDEEQLAFASLFGTPYVHPLGRVNGRTSAGVERIIDSPERPPYQDVWHTDVSWDVAPPVFGTLRAVDLPSRGGDTIWVDMYGAFALLSPVMQGFLATRTAWHEMGRGRSFVTKMGADLVARTRAQFPGARHPVAPEHPVTGRRYLYVNREFTAHIDELTDGESDALLGWLTALATNPNLQVRHRWTVGELAIWDERCTQHYAVADYLPHRREMARVAVLG